MKPSSEAFNKKFPVLLKKALTHDLLEESLQSQRKTASNGAFGLW